MPPSAKPKAFLLPMNGYELSRIWFDWCFENPEKISPNHSALYFFAIEHCNRLGWREKFGFPTEMAKDAIGIKSYKTYINTLNDLVEFGFIKMIERSKNQYSANIIGLVNFDKALTNALDKAITKHVSKQDQSTCESISTINKPLTNKQLNKETYIPEFDEFKNFGLEKEPKLKISGLKNKYDSWVLNGWKDGNNKKISNWKSKLLNTIQYLEKETSQTQNRNPAHSKIIS